MDQIIVKGDFGMGKFTSADTGGNVTGRYLNVNLEASINFFKRLTLVMPSLVENQLGLYSSGSIGSNNEVRFASMSTPRWLLRARGNKGCVWDPVGNVSISLDSFQIYPLVYQGEQCPDVYWGQCFEKIMGTGNQVIDQRATAEQQIIFAEMMARIYEGFGNSIYDLMWFGKHPLITWADTNNRYNLDEDEWANFKNNQDVFSGWLTIVDGLKASAEYEGYDIPIDPDDVDKKEYIGRVSGPNGIFDKVIEAQSTEAKLSASNSGSDIGKGIILVNPGIFKKYKEELLQDYNQIPDMLYFRMNGEFCAKYGCTEGIRNNVLKYDGYWVVSKYEWELWDNILDVYTHRVLMVTPGALGYATDVQEIPNAPGDGFRMYQDMTPKGGGLVTMDAYFKAGTGIVDPRFVRNASIVDQTDYGV